MMFQLSNIHSQQVDRIHNPAETEFNDKYGFCSKPVIITGLMEQWKARHNWTSEFFKTNYGSFEEYGFRCDDENKRKLFKISEYIDYMQNCPDAEPYYLKNCQFHLKTNVIDDYTVPIYFQDYFQRFYKNLPFRLSWLFMGATNTYSKLHQDIFNTSAWNAVISGRKLWLFYPSDQEQYLYEGAVNPFKPNISRYCNFQKANPLVCVQNPGEVVFTPGGWWHAVYNLEGGISITENFVNSTNCRLVQKTLVSLQKHKEIHMLEQCMNFFLKSEKT